MKRAAACLLLSAVVFAVAAPPAGAQTIPPGQEDLLSAMLGKGTQLPDGCALGDGRIEHDVVQVPYHCPDGDVVVRLAYPSTRGGEAIVTKRFALTVVSGPSHPALVRALEAAIRSQEGDFEWSTLSAGGDTRPSFASVLLLLALAIPASVGAWRAWTESTPMALGLVAESLIVAAVVVTWLQLNADPPAHPDTAIDVALARDCIASHGASCVGHAASAIGLLQGQAFTYALAVWLALGLSMSALGFVAACTHGATIGILHYATARRFGGVAWIVSAAAAALGIYMTSYPVQWNPTWFVLPLTIAFLATVALARGNGLWSAFVAGVAFAMSAESHLLFGPFVAVAAVIALMTAARPGAAAAVLLASFVLTELTVSPQTTAINAHILRGWVGAHAGPAALVVMLFAASVPVQMWVRRAIRANATHRESVTVLVWLLTGAVGIGLVLPWAVSRPAQIRYYGVAFPAIAYAIGWLLDAATLRRRSPTVRFVAIGVFAAIFAVRIHGANFATSTWFMDDGKEMAAVAGLADTSALDLQLIVREIPVGSLRDVTAAFAGTPDVPVFPPRIVRALRPGSDIEMPAGWDRIRTARGDIATSAIDAWLRPEEAEVCPDPPTGEPCTTLTPDDFRSVAGDSGFLHRAFGLRIARGATSIAEWTQRGARALSWKMPLRPAGSDATHEIVFIEEGEQIIAVDGAPSTARSDRHAVVDRPTPGAAAFITVRTPVTGKYEAGVPPLPIELRAGELGVLPGVPALDGHG